MQHCLLTRYLEIRNLPLDIRYLELKRWEQEVEIYLATRKENVIPLFAVNQR